MESGLLPVRSAQGGQSRAQGDFGLSMVSGPARTYTQLGTLLHCVAPCIQGSETCVL